MRWTTALATTALIGASVMPGLPNSAAATGWGHRYHAPRYDAPVPGVVPAPYRYLRCRGGRIYTALGGWGCDYYYSPSYLPRRR